MPSPFKIPFLDGDPREQEQQQAPPVDPNAIPQIPTIGATPQIMSGLGGQSLPEIGAAPAGPRVVSERQADREALIGSQQAQLADLNKPHMGQPGSSHPGTGGKILHGLATAGNILGDIFAPNVMDRVPGTQRYNDAKKEKLEGEIDKENALGTKEAADQSEVQSQNQLRGATAAHLNQETNDLQHPKPAAPEIHDTPMGLMAIDKQNATATPVKADGTPIGPKLETSVVPGIISPLDGRPHTYLVDKQGKKVADLGEHYEKPITIKTGGDAHEFAEEQRGRGLLDKAEGAYRTAEQGANGLRAMVDNAKVGDKMSARMLPLEGALEITTAQGVHRINRTEVDQFAGGGNLFDRLAGMLKGAATGVPFTPEILNSMAHLADIQQKGAYDNYKGAYDSATNRYHLRDEKPLDAPRGSGGGGGGAPQGADNEVYVSGKLVGHTVGGKYVPLGR